MRLVRYLQWLCLGLASLSILAMTLIGGIDVIATTAINAPIPAAYEATEMLMVVVVFLALGHLEAQRMQIAVDIVQRRLGRGAQTFVAVLSGVLALIFYTLLTWQAWLMAVASWAIREYSVGLVRFPIYPSKFAVVLGGALAVICCAMQLAEVLRGGAPRSEAASPPA